jgi:enoyl-CoA hydratase
LRDQVGHVLVLTLNRPEVRNALNPGLMQELSDALLGAADDETVRVVVLTGAGDKAFCAGMDLKAWAGIKADDGDGMSLDALTWFNRDGFVKPVIAAVNGFALAGGLELALGADLIVAAEHATFGLAEVKRALFAAGGGTALGARIPLAVALELGLTGDPIDAGRAYAVGLVNRVVPGAELMTAAMELAERIAANGPLGVQVTKRLMRAAALVDPQRGWPGADDVDLVFNSKDAIEGASAFVEKREPRWTGE